MIGSQRVQRKPSAQMPLLFSGAQRQYQVRLLLADQVLRFEAQGRVIYLLLTKSSYLQNVAGIPRTYTFAQKVNHHV